MLCNIAALFQLDVPGTWCSSFSKLTIPDAIIDLYFRLPLVSTRASNEWQPINIIVEEKRYESLMLLSVELREPDFAGEI
jgi:hypothetical protein